MSGGFPLSVVNIYNAGIKVVEDIVFNNWESVYANGITPTNYIGDIFGSLGGVPDFGYVCHYYIRFEDSKLTHATDRIHTLGKLSEVEEWFMLYRKTMCMLNCI